MTHTSVRAAASVAATCLAVMLASAADDAHAQCATCATPTVAYAPVVAAPATVVVAPRVGLFDRMRLRRWGYTAPVVAAPYTAAYAPAYTAAYAPAYTAAYAPAYTAAYAPAYTAAYAPAYTAAYAPAVSPYMTSYAPLQQPVVQTSYMPVVPAAGCSSCATAAYAPVVTTNYAPTTLYRQAVLSPVVTESCATPCSACAVAAPCSACAAAAPAPCSACAAAAAPAYSGSGYADQASYVAPAAGCSSCAAASGGVQYAAPSGSTGIGGGPATPQPTMAPIPASSGSSYPPDPAPIDEAGASFGAPQLLAPANDRTARSPTVDIHTAVYRRPATAANVSTAAARPASTAAAVDASAWSTGQ